MLLPFYYGNALVVVKIRGHFKHHKYLCAAVVNASKQKNNSKQFFSGKSHVTLAG